MHTLAPRRDAPVARLYGIYGQPGSLRLLLILAVTALVFGACSSRSTTSSPAASTLAPSASAGSVVTFRTASRQTSTLTVEIADTAEER